MPEWLQQRLEVCDVHPQIVYIGTGTITNVACIITWNSTHSLVRSVAIEAGIRP